MLVMKKVKPIGSNIFKRAEGFGSVVPFSLFAGRAKFAKSFQLSAA